MRMGKGYFWKSRGKRTTASHCSPSLPDRRPTQSTTTLTATAAPAGPRPTPQPRAAPAPGLTLVQLHEGGVGVQLLLAVPRVRQERLPARRHREPRDRPARAHAQSPSRHTGPAAPAHSPARANSRAGLPSLPQAEGGHRPGPRLSSAAQSERREGGAARTGRPMREQRCVWRVGRWREFDALRRSADSWPCCAARCSSAPPDTVSTASTASTAPRGLPCREPAPQLGAGCAAPWPFASRIAVSGAVPVRLSRFRSVLIASPAASLGWL